MCFCTPALYMSLPAWCHAGTGTRHGPLSVLSQVGVLLKWLNELGWFLAWELPSTYPTLCYREILVPPKIRVLPSGTLRQTLDFKKILPLHIDRRNVLPSYQLSSRKMDARSVINWTVVSHLVTYHRAPTLVRCSLSQRLSSMIPSCVS